MTPREIRGCGLGCSLFFFLLMGAMFTMPAWWSPDENTESFLGEDRGYSDPYEEETGTRPADGVPSPAGREISASLRLRSELTALLDQRKFEELLLRCRDLIDEASPESIQAVSTVYPRALQEAFNEQLRGPEWSGARTLIEEAVESARESFTNDASSTLTTLTKEMTRQYRDKRWQEFSNAVQAKQTEEADQWADAIAEDQEESRFHEDYLADLMRRWKEARTKGDQGTGEMLLSRAARYAAGDVHSILYWQGWRRSPMETAFKEAFPASELLALGDASLAAEDYSLAAGYYAALHWSEEMNASPRPSSADRAQLRKDLAQKNRRALIGMAESSLNGHNGWLPPDRKSNTLECLLTQVSSTSNRVRGRGNETEEEPLEDEKNEAANIRKIWELLLRLHAGRVERLLESEEYIEAENHCRHVLTEVAASWFDAQRQLGKNDLWDKVPEETRLQIEKRDSNPETQFAVLLMEIRQGKYTPPFPRSEDFLDWRVDARGREGLNLLRYGSLSQCYPALRDTLRERPESPLSTEVKEELCRHIRESFVKKDFQRLYDLSSFFLGEVNARQLPEELRTELEENLAGAADFYKQNSPMKRVFMLSLQADIRAGDPAGDKLAAAVMAEGLAAVDALPLSEPRKADINLPSVLPGYSVMAIENSTEYHLMVFFNGPERFFVRLNPYRGGVVVAADGKYVNAVIVTSDEVRPYKGHLLFNTEHQAHRYYIDKGQGEQANDLFQEMTMDYTLLRQPASLGELTLDRITGQVLPASPTGSK